jgi:hypothetical protein
MHLEIRDNEIGGDELLREGNRCLPFRHKGHIIWPGQ